MANTFPAAVKARLKASGGGAAVSLLEVYTVNGNYYAWSDSDITTAGMLPIKETLPGVGGGAGRVVYTPLASVTFQPWLLSAGPFKTTNNTTTSTGEVAVQNLSGDTVRRDISSVFSRNAMMGALVYFRSWLADAQFATYSFYGSVSDVDLEADGEAMTLQLDSLAAWAKLDAPYKEIGQTCPLAFGSIECGSTSVTPCDNSYGSCSSTERFQGVLVEWVGSALDPTQYVQPAPLTLANPKVAG